MGTEPHPTRQASTSAPLRDDETGEPCFFKPSVPAEKCEQWPGALTPRPGSRVPEWGIRAMSFGEPDADEEDVVVTTEKAVLGEAPNARR
jgi:hypothetical protein